MVRWREGKWLPTRVRVGDDLTGRRTRGRRLSTWARLICAKRSNDHRHLYCGTSGEGMARGHTPSVEILQRAVEILQWVARGVAVLWHTRRVGMAHGRRRWHLYCQPPGIGGVRLAAGRPCEGHGARSLRRQGEGMAPGRLGG